MSKAVLYSRKTLINELHMLEESPKEINGQTRIKEILRLLHAAVCRFCGKDYDIQKSRADIKGYCSAKCQHEMAKKLGWKKPWKRGRLKGPDEFTILKRNGQVGDVYRYTDYDDRPAEGKKKPDPTAPTASTPAKTRTTQTGKQTADTVEAPSPGGSEKRIISNTYFKDDGAGRSFISGLSLPKGPDRVVRNIKFVGCSFHPICQDVKFVNCEFVDCHGSERLIKEDEERPDPWQRVIDKATPKQSSKTAPTASSAQACSQGGVAVNGAGKTDSEASMGILIALLSDHPRTWRELLEAGLDSLSVMAAIMKIVKGGGFAFHVGPDIVALDKLGL